MNYVYDTFASPLGNFSVALDETGAVAATAFGDLDALKKRLPMDNLTRKPSLLEEVRAQILDYFAGKRRDFDVRMAPQGTPFQLSVWEKLQRIPFGQTRTYGEIAAELGNAGASRAVGRANGANALCLIVPCHRVIGADGSLTGFAFGEKIKRQLLEHEGVRFTSSKRLHRLASMES